MGIPVNKNQDIWSDGIDILSRLCNNLWFSYRDMPIKDVGIDWEIELREDWFYNKKFQVQVKTSEKFNIKNNKLKVRAIKREKLEYWNNDINLPVFMIAVEKNTERIFWIDTRPYYEKIKNNSKQKEIIISADIINELSIKNKDKFIKFTKELDKYNAEKVLIKSSHLEKIRIIWKRKWYKTIEDNNSISLIWTQKSINNPISWNILINRKIQENEYEVENIKINIWDEIVSEFSKWKLQILDYYEDMELFLQSWKNEYKIKAKRTTKWNKWIIKSVPWEFLDFNIDIDINTGTVKFNMNYELDKLKNLEELKDILSFAYNMRDGLKISVLTPKGKKETIIEEWLKNLDWYPNKIFVELVSLLFQIEKKYNLNINIKDVLNEKITYRNMLDIIPYYKAIIEWTYIIKWKSTLSVTLTEISKQSIPKEKQCIRIKQPNFEVFWNYLPIDVYVDWCGFITNKNKKYFIETDELIFHIKKSDI